MYKEQLTDKEGICTLMLFIAGSTLIIGIGGDAKNNAWIVGIIGIIMALPIIAVYARIISIFPGKDLFEISELCLGKIAGKVVSCVYIWYSFHLGSLVLRNFGEFINSVTMPETPKIVPLLMVGVVCIFAVRSGIEVISRFSTFILPSIIIIVVIVQILGISQWDISNFKPIMHNALGDVIKGGYSAFSFPFAETVLFLGVFYTLKTKRSPYKVFYFAVLFAGFLIITLTMRNIAVLGNMLSMLYFPSYVAVGRISIGEFLQRLEVSVALVFLVSVFVKASVCLFVTCRGISRLFNFKDYSIVAINVGLLMISMSYFIYDNIMEMSYWAFKVYQYYAFPMEVIFPLIIWLFAELKARKLKKLK